MTASSVKAGFVSFQKALPAEHEWNIINLGPRYLDPHRLTVPAYSYATMDETNGSTDAFDPVRSLTLREFESQGATRAPRDQRCHGSRVDEHFGLKA